MFGHFSGHLGHEDLGNDRGHIDAYIFMLKKFISEAVSGRSTEKQAKPQPFPLSIINSVCILRYCIAVF